MPVLLYFLVNVVNVCCLITIILISHIFHLSNVTVSVQTLLRNTFTLADFNF